MFNRDGCRYLLSCLAFSEIHLSWLSKLSYHPLMFQQQDDSFRMVLPHFWHLKSVNWDHLRGIWKWYSVMWLMQNYYLNTAMRPGQMIFFPELSALKLQSHIPVPTSFGTTFSTPVLFGAPQMPLQTKHNLWLQCEKGKSRCILL